MLKFGHGDWLHLKLFRINSVWTALRAMLGWPLLAVGFYGAAALVGSAIPVNEHWTPPTKGHTIYLYDNGIHTSLIIPRNQDGVDLGYRVADPPLDWMKDKDGPNDFDSTPPAELPDDRFPGSTKEYPFLMFGWGDARFYQDTPHWADFRPKTAMAALFGSGQTMIHVDRLERIPTIGIRKINLRAKEFGRLLEFLVLHFPDNFEAKAQPTPGYGSDDRFFPIGSRWHFTGTPDLRYSALFTCNNWVNEALKRSGVKTGYWTPLPFGVMWWYD
jgi:uncharacterized protein (TIGR02117 family)